MTVHIDIEEYLPGSFHKCYGCGYVTVKGRSVHKCCCDPNRIMLIYYPECPQCKENSASISHCTFCTNSGYGRTEYEYVNGYVKK